MLILFALVIIVVNLGVVLYLFSLFSESPYIGVPKSVLPEIVKALDLKTNQVVYDLGCGDGRILFAAYRSQPDAQYIGVEINLVPYFIALAKKLLIGNPRNIVFRRGDMYLQNCSDADRVFAYLFPRPVQELWIKLQNELRPGAVLISCHFRPSIAPDTEILLQRGNDRAKKLYKYNF